MRTVRSIGLLWMWATACIGCTVTMEMGEVTQAVGADAAPESLGDGGPGPERERIVFVNERDESLPLCPYHHDPVGAPIEPAVPPPDAGSAGGDIMTPEEPAGAADRCECAIWNGEEWERAPRDNTQSACEPPLPETTIVVCEAGTSSGMMVRMCASPVDAMCAPPALTRVSADNFGEGNARCNELPATPEGCQQVTYEGVRREAESCDPCQYASPASPPDDAEPHTAYYRWVTSCEPVWGDRIRQMVEQRCHLVTHTTWGRPGQDGVTVNNYCEHFESPACPDVTCNRTVVSAASGCQEATTYYGTCIPNGTDPSTLPAPTNPAYWPTVRRLDASDPDAGASDAGTSEAGTPDAGISDAGISDAGRSDAGRSDAGAADAGAADAGAADAGA
ncbi:MAG: hypothetical protein AB7S26_26525 [Sandaracinaceae bacterium]